MRKLASTLLLAVGCGSSPEEPALSCPSPLVVAGERCVPALDACSESSIPKPGGGCAPVGVDRCEPGFAAEGGGCRAILPEAPCGPGEVALPGESSCHALAECGAGTWGDIPLQPDAIFVDASAAADGDGTKERPFRTIALAIGASTKRAGSPQIAIAAGTYVEQIVAPHPVRLFGRCPSLVELSAPDSSGSWAFASGQDFEVHTLTVRGGDNGGISAVGVALEGAPDPFVVRIDRVRATGGRAFGFGASSGPRIANVTVVDSLVEDVEDAGLAFVSAHATVDRTVVRRIAASTKAGASGVIVSKGPKVSPGTVLVRRSLVEHAPYGVSVLQGTVTVEGSLLRDLLRGEGVEGGAGASTTGTKGTSLTVTGSVIERAQTAGVFGSGSSITLDRATIRDVVAVPETGVAEGVQMVGGGELLVRHSLVTGCKGIGVFVGDGTALVESSIVRGVGPRVGFGDFGAGIAAQCDRGSSTLSLRDVWIDDTRVAGLQSNGATLDVASALITRVGAQEVDGLFGDGLAVQSAMRKSGELVVGRATVQQLVVREVARAGIGVFGAELDLGGSVLGCSAFPLALAERFSSFGPQTNDVHARDLGGNACGCTTWGSCRAQVQSIAPTPSFSPG